MLKPKPKFAVEPASSSTLIFAVAILCLFICHSSLHHRQQIMQSCFKVCKVFLNRESAADDLLREQKAGSPPQHPAVC